MRLRASTAEPAGTHKRLPVFHGRGGLVAGVDGRSNEALLDLLDDLPDAWLASAVVHQSEHLVSFDRDFRKLLGRSQLTLLKP